MKTDAQTRDIAFKLRNLFAVAAAAMFFAPAYAHAQSAPGYASIFSAPPPSYSNGYGGGVFRSWLDMVSASQAAQPNWMTPLVTVTPRLEQ
jgi:hypothetical protein